MNDLKLIDAIGRELANAGVACRIYCEENVYTKKLRYYAECEYHTRPNGYDFIFIIECGSDVANLDVAFCRDLMDYTRDFDPEEEMAPYIARRGQNGIPATIRALLDDGNDCADILRKLTQSVCRILDAERRKGGRRRAR